MVLIKSKKDFFFKQEMIRQGYNHFDSRRNRKYITKQDIELLAYIKKTVKNRLENTIN